MPIVVKSESVFEIGEDRDFYEANDEPFDRCAFARRAIDIVHLRRTTVAICEGALRLRVESGRLWGRPAGRARGLEERPERWAMLTIPADASRRAIALAVASLAGEARAYAIDVLMAEAAAPEAGPEHTAMAKMRGGRVTLA